MIEATNLPKFPPEDFIEEMHPMWESLSPIRDMDPTFPPFGAWVDLMWVRETGGATSRAIARENARPAGVNPMVAVEEAKKFTRPVLVTDICKSAAA